MPKSIARLVSWSEDLSPIDEMAGAVLAGGVYMLPPPPPPPPPQAATTSVVAASTARRMLLVLLGFMSASRAGQRRRQVGEGRVEVRRGNRRAVRERRQAHRCVLRLAQPEVDAVAADGQRVAEPAHDHAQRDVDGVVARTPAIR